MKLTTSAMTATQMISDHSQTPNTWPNKPTCGATFDVCGGSAPGMGDASVSSENMSTSPTPAQTTIAATMPHPTGTPSCQSQYMTQGANRNTCPADRSIFPSISTRTSPIAIAATGPA